MCDLCDNKSKVTIRNHDITVSLCKDCVAHCKKCDSSYAKNGYCKCATIEEVIETIEEKIGLFDNVHLHGETILNTLLVNVVVDEKTDGTDTTAWNLGEYLILSTNDEVKSILAWQNKYGMRSIAEFEESSVYIVPYMEEANWAFVSHLSNTFPIFNSRNVYFTDDYLAKLKEAYIHFVDNEYQQQYIDFVADMIEICKSIESDYIMSDMRGLNVREYNGKPIPYDVFYTYTGCGPECTGCSSELYNGEGIAFDNKIWCDNCKTICENCNAVIDPDDAFYIDSIAFCSDCFEEQYTYCYNCDCELERAEALIFDDDEYCKTCFARITEE